MSLVATLEALRDAGATADMLIAAVRVHEAQQAAKAESRREKDAARKRAQRVRDGHAESRGHDVTSRDSAEPSPRTCEPDARVVTLTSSLRSEGTQEANASFVDASTPAEPEKPPTKPPKSQRGTRLPEDWEPSAEEFDLGRDAGLTDEEIRRAALEFRNYWCSRSRDAAKLSWRLTWHNRVNELGDRKRRASARLAAASAKPGGGRRGSSTFADIYARRHGPAEDGDALS